MTHLRALARQLHAFQIDSVNVLTRAHYVPAFARLGPYQLKELDTLAYQKRELFEHWGHAACLLPISLYPIVRYCMDKHREHTHKYMRSKRGVYMAKVYEEVAERGPLTAAELSNPGQRSGKWWGWGTGKATLEYLYDSGLVAIAGRRGFERLYDLTERVIPRPALEAPAPAREDAMKPLICLAAEACGVGTFGDLIEYVSPFLLGDTLVARCDLKTDRGRGVLMVRSAFLEPGQNARHVVPDLAGELRQMQTWLSLDRIEIGERGDLARPLRTNMLAKVRKSRQGPNL